MPTAVTVDHRVAIADRVATVTLDRPQAYNALTAALLDSLLATMRGLAADDAIGAVVLTGEGKGFCAGQALDDEATLRPGEPIELAETIERRYSPLITTIMTMEKPVIAAVNGVAAGAGFGIACACDLRIASETASFTTAFVKIGLVPDSGISFLLPRLIGYGKALEASLLSERISAQAAERLGLVTKVVPPDALAAEAAALAGALAHGPRSLGLIKRELLRNGMAELREALAYEAQVQTIAAKTADFAEGVAAFREKRAPQFRGA